MVGRASAKAILLNLCLLGSVLGCKQEPAKTVAELPKVAASTLEEADSMLRVGMSEEEVEAIMGGSGPGENTSHGVLGEPYFPFPVDIPTTPADSRTFYIGPKAGLVVCFLDDKLVDWSLSPNRAPLTAKIAKLRVGQTYDEIRKIMGPDQGNNYGWNGKFVGRRLIYQEGSYSPCTGYSDVVIDLQREVVVCINDGSFAASPLPWTDDWDPDFNWESDAK